ncbi:thylakoid lumenal 15.0 kDa protein 2, chloroplastic-like isoform X2 [Panicum virgatum]|uniref:thylakoid lumenal 15.0 kDa protein 2, chloroplastic-like isoform X2 n=1 Tax=Panicum virgatum TaxID=38727 RepID=UPI0019D5BD72|nr:thylakoid lumenal 15.0 kDa protein 2, chloroplastic-like isoform X2 [Panicum virgatum]
MALALPSVRLLPLAPSRATAPTSSPLSVTRTRPRALPLPRVRCCASRISHRAAAASEATPSWAGELASSVPWKAAVSGALALAVCFTCFVGSANARTGVNKPELLPKEFTTVIDVAGFLSSGQENRLRQEIEDLEKDTGYKLRVLAQNYPDTPGLAIKDFWQVDERTIVFVADPTFGNIINFNVGPLVDLDVPRSFWSQVSGEYGNMFYWKEKESTNIFCSS